MMRCNVTISMTAAAWVCCVLLNEPNFAESLSSSFKQFKCATLRSDPKLNHKNDCERRTFLKKATSVVGLVTAAPANAIESDPSAATEIPLLNSAPITTGDFDCLLDLPPITPGCARLYLCRHGQTENNRLKLAQGARADPSINSNGYEQAQRMGMAVSRLEKSGAGGVVVPRLAVHSNLRRARETARVLVSTAASQSAASNRPALKVVGEVPSIGEVDFGNLEGKDVKYFRRATRSTFASWSIGNIDRRTGGEGESGREVLERAALSLEQLGRMATTSSSSILAVSHSLYLRVLLSMVNDSPLAESVLWKIRNGSFNVVDINVEGKKRLITSNSGLFGGEIVGKLRGSNGLQVEIPEVHLIRRNEVRHLQGMDV
mmetsp:Transcript_18149/g.39076  ORF Transcript_18149/g.39076 Transcript_18149/m.39076 type:complete len:375 (+) Transcript_18149:189-1313(+)